MKNLYFIAIFLSIITGVAHANLLVNGDFETGNFSGWTYSGAVEISSESDYIHHASTIGLFPSGDYAANFGGANQAATGVLSQIITTITGLKYSLEFDYGKLHGYAGPQSVQIEVANAGVGQVLLNNIITDATGSHDLSNILDHYLLSFIAEGSSTLLSFKDVSGSTFSTDGVLDNVVVNVSSIPEPTTLTLIFGCLSLITVRLSRKVL